MNTDHASKATDARVLMLSTDHSAMTAGSPTYERLASYAERLGALTVLVVGAKKDSERVEAGKLAVEAVPVSYKLFVPWIIARAVRAYLSPTRPAASAAADSGASGAFDVVSAQDPFETGLGALWGVRATHTPLHVQLHTDFLSPYYAAESLKNRIRIRIADRVLPKAAGIRVVSERVKRSLLARYGSRIAEPVVIPVSVSLPNDAALAAPALPAHPFSFALVTVGRLEVEKHFEDIIDAVAIVRARFPHTGLFVLGRGRLVETLEARARARGIGDAVIFLGERPHDEMRALLASAHAYIQASTYEGYGRTLIEAALARLPIITTDVGIVGDVLKPDRDALVVPVGDVPAMAAAITRLIEDNDLRAKIASEASHTARNHLMANMAQADEVAEDLARTAHIHLSASVSAPSATLA